MQINNNQPSFGTRIIIGRDIKKLARDSFGQRVARTIFRRLSRETGGENGFIYSVTRPNKPVSAAPKGIILSAALKNAETGQVIQGTNGTFALHNKLISTRTSKSFREDLLQVHNMLMEQLKPKQEKPKVNLGKVLDAEG